MYLETNSQLQLAYDFLQYTNQNVFLTGKAGTGKTTFLHNLRKNSPKRMVVVAPTGVAAINAGGVTIHSFFQVSFGPQIPRDPNSPRPVEVSADGSVAAGIKRFSKDKINIIRSLDLLVIDEISMVRADLLDAIDEVLRRYKNRFQPFGGVQLLMIGDLQQLAPVVKDDEWDILKPYYDTCYFFSSRALKKSRFVGIELKKIFRQSDQHFIDLLNRVRENRMDGQTLEQLNNRFQPDFAPDDNQGYITLTTHNFQAQQINEAKLSKLKAPKHTFKAKVEGEFPEYSFPTDHELVLKTGAQVMFVKNDSSPLKLFFNGKIGKITSIGEEGVEVLCPGETEAITVVQAEWQNCKYTLNENTQEIDELVIGQFVQLPLKLAWAITIHKSQGLTFERAIIDAQLSFAHGQVYVALSRCKTLEGLVLRSPISLASVKNDHTVAQFSNQVEQNQPGATELNLARKQYQSLLITELFDFKPLLRQLQLLLTRWKEGASALQGNVDELFHKIPIPVQNELLSVSDRFQPFLHNEMEKAGDAEKNPILLEKLKSGSAYFLQKMKQYFENPLSEVAFQSDNKAVNKNIAETIERLTKEVYVKKACLEKTLEGFSIKNYLEARAKASIESPALQGTKARAYELASVKNAGFYHELLDWRKQVAEKMNVPVSKVIGQNVLIEIAGSLPATNRELHQISGLGNKKIQQFGQELLKKAIAFRKEKGLEIPEGSEKDISLAGLSTRQLSYELYKRGKKADEIAVDRGLAVSTIFGHLADFVASGQLDVHDLVDREHYKIIAKALELDKEKSFGEIRASLGDHYDYAEIKLVAAHLGLLTEKPPSGEKGGKKVS